jgi:hypothetical protein
MLKVTYREKKTVAFGKVIYGQDIGMGIALTTVEPEGQQILEDWFGD